MKALKILGIIIGVVVILVAAGIAVVSLRFDGDRVKLELVQLVKEKTQRTLKIDGDLHLSFWPNVGVRLGQMSLSEQGSTQAFASVDSARASVAVMPLLSGTFVVNTIEIIGASATLVKHKDGTLNVDDLLATDDQAPQTASPSHHIEIAAIKIANMALTSRDEKSGSTTKVSGLNLSTGHVEVDTGKKIYLVNALSLALKGQLDKPEAGAFAVKLQAPRISITPEKSSSEAISFDATLTSPQRNISAKLTLAAIEGNRKTFHSTQLALALDGSMNGATIKGALRSPLSVNLKDQTVVLSQLTGDMTVAHPQMPMKQLKLPINGHLDGNFARPSVSGDLSTQFDESKIALKFNVAKFEPLALGFSLNIDKLNVDKYLPQKKAASNAQGSNGKGDLAALNGFNLDGMVTIGSLQVANIKASNVKLPIKAAGGRLVSAAHSASLYDGTLVGDLTLNATGNTVALKEQLTGIAINPLLRDLIGKDVIEGHGNVALDVTSRGTTVSAMKKSLAGSASLSLKNGAIKGINLAQTLRDAQATFSSKQEAVQEARQSEKTDFSELSASFKIANGVAHNQDLSGKSPFLRLAGNGDIDIGNERISYLLRASIVPTAGGQGAKDLQYLKGLTVPVRVSGPFDKLTYTIDFADLAKTALKAEVEQQVDNLKQKLREQLQDRIKGLFGK